MHTQFMYTQSMHTLSMHTQFMHTQSMYTQSKGNILKSGCQFKKVTYRITGTEADLQRRAAGIRQQPQYDDGKYTNSYISFSHLLTKLLSFLHHFMIVGLYVCHWSTGHPQQTEDQVK